MKSHFPINAVKVAYENLLASTNNTTGSLRSQKTIKRIFTWEQLYTVDIDLNEYQIQIPFELEEELFYKFGNEGYGSYSGTTDLIVSKENDSYNFEIKTTIPYVESWDEQGNIFAYFLVISEDVFGNVKTAYYFQKDKVGLVSETADSNEGSGCDLIKELKWFTNEKNYHTSVENDYKLLCIEKKCIKWLGANVAIGIKKPVNSIGSVWIRGDYNANTNL